MCHHSITHCTSKHTRIIKLNFHKYDAYDAQYSRISVFSLNSRTATTPLSLPEKFKTKRLSFTTTRHDSSTDEHNSPHKTLASYKKRFRTAPPY